MEEYDLLQCIEKGLDPFGSHIKQTIYWRITMLHGSMQSAIISNPTIFTSTLKEIFADSSWGVEKSIMKHLRETFELKSEDCVDLTKALMTAVGLVTPSYSGAPQMMAPSMRA